MAITRVLPVIGVETNESHHELYYEFSNSENRKLAKDVPSSQLNIFLTTHCCLELVNYEIIL